MPPPNPHTESYRVSWMDPPTANKITLSVTSVSVPDTTGVTSIVCQKDASNKYPDRSGIEEIEDTTALIRLRSGTFGLACTTLKVGSIVSYVSTKTVSEDLSAFSW